MEYSVSGCIVTHNNKSSICKTIESLYKYTENIDFKLYVVDNASTDGTVDVIRKNFPQVEIIESKENKGFGAGHNAVIKKLNSKYHFLINPDISVRDDVFTKMAEYMDKNEDIGILSPKICCPDGSKQVLGKREPKIKYLAASRFRKEEPSKLLREYAMLDRDDSDCYDIEIASGCFVMIRTDIFKKIGGFDDRYFLYFEDFDLSRTVRQNNRVVYFPFASVYHEWERGSKKNKKLLIIHCQSLVKYKLKWMFK